MTAKQQTKLTQGRTLIERLKLEPHTYLDMLSYGISTSPWKRITESLLPGEEVRKTERRGLVHWSVGKVKKA
jgi:hypothetical protein